MSDPIGSPVLTSALVGADFGTPAQQAHLLGLEQTASAAMAAKRPWLRFTPQLEWQFELDSTENRVARFRVLGFIALVIINLFNITDRTMLPDIADRALTIRLGILTPTMALLLAALHWPLLARLREWVTSGLVVLVSGSLVYFFSQSQHPNALQYHTGVILVLMFGNIVIRQRFWYALATSVVVVVMFVAGITHMQQMTPEVQLNSEMVLFAAAAISLVANYQMEYDARQTYLHTLLQRIDALKLKRSRDELDRQAHSDPLTGLANRRYFDNRLVTEWSRSQREFETIAIIYIDVDYFKAYNDHYGHQAGDACLVRVGKEIQQCVQRNNDVCARYGGEEFVILLPQTSFASAMGMAEKVRATIEAAGLRHEFSDVSSVVTVSCGVACTAPAPGDSSSKLIEAADQALYASKSAGRNRVSSCGEPRRGGSA